MMAGMTSVRSLWASVVVLPVPVAKFVVAAAAAVIFVMIEWMPSVTEILSMMSLATSLTMTGTGTGTVRKTVSATVIVIEIVIVIVIVIAGIARVAVPRFGGRAGPAAGGTAGAGTWRPPASLRWCRCWTWPSGLLW